jgi:hypothetical protein
MNSFRELAAKCLSRQCVVVQEMHNEIQDVLGQSFALPDGLDEDDLMEELDALDDEMAAELESGGRAGVPSYLQARFCPSGVVDLQDTALQFQSEISRSLFSHSCETSDTFSIVATEGTALKLRWEVLTDNFFAREGCGVEG